MSCFADGSGHVDAQDRGFEDLAVAGLLALSRSAEGGSPPRGSQRFASALGSALTPADPSLGSSQGQPSSSGGFPGSDSGLSGGASSSDFSPSSGAAPPSRSRPAPRPTVGKGRANVELSRFAPADQVGFCCTVHSECTRLEY